MERIQRDHIHTEIAMQALYWATSATRPLSLTELIHALAVEPGDMKYDEDNELLVDITSVYAALIVIDPMTDTVRLAHYTAGKYLKSQRQTWFPHIFEHSATQMLTYLSFKRFQREFEEDVSIHDLHRDFPLLLYETLNWGTIWKDWRMLAMAFGSKPKTFCVKISDFLILLLSFISKSMSTDLEFQEQSVM